MEEKDFKRLVMCLQITMTAGDGETTAAITQANRIMERHGLRWDEWLPGLRQRGKQKAWSTEAWEKARSYEGPSPEEQRREWKSYSYKPRDKEHNPSWTLNAKDLDWVIDVCTRAVNSSAIQGSARRFVGDMLSNAKLFRTATVVSQKQWDWLQSIELILQRARKAG